MSQEIKQSLTAEQANSLRGQGMLSVQEFAYVAGDLVVAENAVTGEKRILGKTEMILLESSNKRVLKG
jgi:hypothetical protein